MDVRPLLQTLADDALRGDLAFSTHARIARRVQRLLDDPDCATADLVKLISAEPLLSARIVGVANSLAYNPRGQAISDLRGAIARIGFATLRGLATSLVIRQLNDSARQGGYAALAARLWEHTAHVAALARVLARRVTRANPDAAFFAGIAHEVGGFYLLARAREFPGLLDGDFAPWHEDGEAQVGRAVLRALAAPAGIGAAMETLWSGYLALPPASLGDTLLLADRLAPVESPLGALAGMSRRGMDAELEMLVDDATLSLILAESAAEVASLRAALQA